jgi:hypothetical protein
MSGKLQRARRQLLVQKQLDRISEWRLLELLSQSAALEGQRRSLLQCLQQESAFTGMFSISVMRRLQTLAQLQATAAFEEDALRELHLRQRRCRRRAEYIVRALEADEIRKDTARALELTIDSGAQKLRKAPAS